MAAWNIVCVCAASLVRKERSKEMKWSYERVEKTMRVAGCVRNYVHRMFEEIDVEVTVSFVILVVSGRSVNVSRKCCPEVKSLGVKAEFSIAVNIANFGGDVKFFLCVAY